MKKKNNIFWISYSDLTTSLFFIMLVLFVLTTGYLNSVLNTTRTQLKKMKELQAAVKELPQEYFTYQPKYKRFKLNKEIHFDAGSAHIKKKYHAYLKNVGYSILKLVNNLSNDERYKKFDIKYLIVIEGMASKDSYKYNYELSYRRSLALYRFWKKNNIIFDPKICEVQIAGSGTDGIREFSGADEKKNQQFLIHIIPKIGKIE